MTLVTLKNRARKILTFNLTHDCAAPGLDPNPTSFVRLETNKKGEVLPKARQRVFPPVLTLMPDEEREGLPLQVLAVPEVKKAVADRLLKVSYQTEQEGVSSPASAKARRARSNRFGDSD